MNINKSDIKSSKDRVELAGSHRKPFHNAHPIGVVDPNDQIQVTVTQPKNEEN